jgi:hypothetical protein
MPNERHWSASMLLWWVLTRDKEAVLSMADQYGGWWIDGESAGRIEPPTWDDVLRAYAIDNSLPKDEQAREAVRRAQLSVIPARQEIFDALRSGKIKGWARSNGSGDIVKIDPVQWAGLRFCAVNGHDIAIPVDSEREPLSLPRPLSDYLSGTVPASLTPTVWPDPLFPGDRAISFWPAQGGQPGKRPPPREKPFWPAAHAAIFEWLAEEGCPAPGDGNQALLERFMADWLEDRGHKAGETTIRRHVARCIREHRDQPDA